MRHRTVHLALAAGAALGATARGQVAPASEEGPVIVGANRETWKGVRLEKLDFSYEFLGQYQYDRIKQDGQPTLVDRETLYRNLLNVDTQLTIGHKNFIDFAGIAQFGLDDRDIESDTIGQNVSERDTVTLYDLRALILGNGPVPVTPYARREESILDRAFAGSIDQVLSEEGIIAQIRSDWAPTTLQYFHRDQELSDPFTFQDSSTVQDTFTGQSGMRLTDNQRLDLAYTYDHVDEQQAGVPGDTYDRNDANVVHSLVFGPSERRHELRSALRYYGQDGLNEQSTARWDELLILRHTDRLETRYSTTVDQQSRLGQDQTFYRGEASVRHRLFESLTSTAAAGGQRIDSPDGFTSDGVFVNGQLDYTKRAWIGRIDASGGVAFDSQNNSERGSPTGVINEPHVFNDPFPIILARRNIVQGSIVLTPPSGFPRFREGIDYSVTYFPDRAEISVSVGSAIQDGDTVLASYDVGPEPASTIDTQGLTFSIRYTIVEGTFAGLSGYTTYRQVSHTIDAEDPSLFVLDDFEDMLVGLEYMREGLDAKVEYQQRTSTVNPYNVMRGQVRYSRPLGPKSSVNAEYTHETIDYVWESNTVDFDRLTARWFQNIDDSLDFNVRLEYRSERDALRGDSQAFEQHVGVAWRKGQTSVYGTFQNTLVDGPASERTSQMFQIGFKRMF